MKVSVGLADEAKEVAFDEAIEVQEVTFDESEEAKEVVFEELMSPEVGVMDLPTDGSWIEHHPPTERGIGGEQHNLPTYSGLSLVNMFAF